MEQATIYLRVSTKLQDENKQLEDCKKYCDNHGWILNSVFQERVSAFKKDIDRPEQDKVFALANLGEIKHIIVWAFDRWIRNRETLITDVTKLTTMGCKIHSVKDDWLEAINIEGPLGATIREFMLGLVGSLAEMESQRKSERVTLGKKNSSVKQGRKNIRVDEDKVIELYKELNSSRKVAIEYNKLHRPHISHTLVMSIVKKNKQTNEIIPTT